MKNEIKFSLSLFGAGDIVNTTSSNTTGNSLTAEMKTFYDKALIELATPNLVHDQFGQKRKIPAGSGKTVEFRCFSALPKATQSITEGVTPSGNRLNVKSITSTPEQYGDYIELTDVLELTAIDNTVIEATKKLADQAGRTLDTIVRNELIGGTNVIYCPKVTDAGEEEVESRASLDKTCLLTVKQVYMAASELKLMNAPKIDGYYVAIIHPAVAYNLMESAGPRWLSVGEYDTPNGRYVGEIGCIGGVRFVETSEAKVFEGTNGNGSVFCTLFLGADAYGVTEMEGGIENIIKQKGYGNDPLNQRSSVGWKAFKSAKRLVEEYMVRVESCSTFAPNLSHN